MGYTLFVQDHSHVPSGTRIYKITKMVALASTTFAHPGRQLLGPAHKLDELSRKR